MAHKAPEGDSVGQRATQSGYSWQLIYENLHGGSGTAKGAVDAWIASKAGHREAMLDPNIQEIGIGYYFMPFDEGNMDLTHYWTLVMAKKKN